MPLELNCYDDEEGDISETEAAGNYDEATSNEENEPPIHEESVISGHEGPISLAIDSPSTGPPEWPQAETAETRLSGLDETHMYESADQLERDSESPPQHMSVGASSNTHTETRVAGSPQPTTDSRELVPLSDAAPPEELTMQ